MSINGFLWQALSNTVWAFSKLEEKNTRLFAAVATQAQLKIRTFNAQNVANTVQQDFPPELLSPNQTQLVMANCM